MVEHSHQQKNIQDLSFKRHIGNRLSKFIYLSKLYIDKKQFLNISRNFLGAYYIEAIKAEEFLDYHGAKKNRSWYSFRECAASVKMFSHVLYVLLHRSDYHEIIIANDSFQEYETKKREVITILSQALYTISEKTSTISDSFGISGEFKSSIQIEETGYEEFMLEEDRELKNIHNPEKTVVKLASQFLNYGETDLFHDIQNIDNTEEQAALIPYIINEQKLRNLESSYHSLQSQYDTYISETNLEQLDPKLKELRCHITDIYHFLDIATHLSHYFERHLQNSASPLHYISPYVIVDILFSFCLKYAYLFINEARTLCQEMIQAYAEEATISVPIPPYRGFHVRPSTLIAKIVHHYGSNVELFLHNHQYDASNPLELFRVNEEINALKRKQLNQFISSILTSKQEFEIDEEEYAHNLNKAILKLLEENKIMLYDNDFSSKPISIIESETFCEYAKRGIAKLLALGSIDIHIDLNVTFKGDNRVLKDIKKLAETGYGEDQYGNNIMLPKALSYLRR